MIFISLHQKLENEIKSLGAEAKGIRGAEDLIYAVKKQDVRDLGRVGQVKRINAEKINALLNKSHILVVSPLAKGESGHIYNVI